MLADRSVALAVEGRVDERKGPRRRRLLGDDAVAAAVEVEILGFVADHVDAREGRAEMELHVSQIGVLRGVEADGGGGGVAFADLHIDVGHRRIERAGICVRDAVVERHAARWRERHLGRSGRARRCRISAREDDQVRDAFLEPRRVIAEHEHRTCSADTEHPRAGPDEQRAREAVAPRRQEHEPARATAGRGVERLLDGGTVVGATVTARLHGDRARIVRRREEHRGAGIGRERADRSKDRDECRERERTTPHSHWLPSRTNASPATEMTVSSTDQVRNVPAVLVPR